MSYSSEIQMRADRILEKRRDKAFLEAEQRAAEISATLPEVDDIQRQLRGLGLEISQLFFFSGEDIQGRVDALRKKSEALVARRSAILQEHGYSVHALEPQFTCPMCEDKGKKDGKQCACRRAVLKELMRAEVMRFAPLDACTFDNFSLDYYSSEPLENAVVPKNRAEKIYDAAMRYAQSFSRESKNILFLGATGLGKTHLSLAIANVVINRGYSVCYGTSHNICEDLRAEMFGRDTGRQYTSAAVLETDLLILDDLGTEVTNQYNIATIYNIINTRLLSGMPTIISTNYELDELLEKYDQRITSRLTGQYTKMTLFGNDIRNMK